MRHRTLTVVLALILAAAPLAAQKSGPGTATVSFEGTGIDVKGEFPTTLCNGTFLLGKGMSWQTKAGDWQITIASETRASGKVPLDLEDKSVNVVVTANGPGGRSFVRRPGLGGTLTVSDDFKKVDAAFDLRNVVGRDTAKLTITFTCQ